MLTDFRSIAILEVRYGFALRPLVPAADAPLLHAWFTQPRARYWGMQDKCVEEIAEIYGALSAGGHAAAYLGLDEQGSPTFLIECYDPACEEVGEHYDPQPGDLGMHVFVAPASQPVHGYTRRVFAALLHFMFSDLGARRVVVEPDRDNAPVHVLNRAMGFVYTGQLAAFRHKIAALAFCTPSDFHAALSKEYRHVQPEPISRSFSFHCTPDDQGQPCALALGEPATGAQGDRRVRT